MTLEIVIRIEEEESNFMIKGKGSVGESQKAVALLEMAKLEILGMIEASGKSKGGYAIDKSR